MSVDNDHFVALARRREQEISQGIRPASTALQPTSAMNGEPTAVGTEEHSEPVAPQPEAPHTREDNLEELHFRARQALQTIKAECRERGIQGLTLGGRDESSEEVQTLAAWFMEYMFDNSEVRKGKRVFTKGSIHAITALDPTVNSNRAQPLKTGIMLILEDMGFVYRRWPQDRTVELLVDPTNIDFEQKRGQRKHEAKKQPVKRDPVKQLLESSKYDKANRDAQANREIIARDMGGPPPQTAPPEEANEWIEREYRDGKPSPAPAAPRQWPVNFPFLGEQLTVVGFHLDSGRVRVDLVRTDGSATHMWLDKEESSAS